MKNSFISGNNKRLWQHIAALAILGIAVHLLLPQITTLENSLSVLSKMLLWAVGLAVVAQVCSYLGSGLLLQRLLDLFKYKVSLLRGTLIVLAAASVSMIAGGTVGSSAAIFKWTSGEKSSIGRATLASIFPPLLNTLLLVFFSIFGIIHLIVVHDLTQAQMFGFGATLLFLGLVACAIFLVSRYQNHAYTAIIWISRQYAKFRHKPIDIAEVKVEIDHFFTTWGELWKGKWQWLIIGALLNVIFDILTLYFIFRAGGVKISIGVLLAGYGLPLLLGKMAFFLPGGLGVVESSMAALYTGLGIPNSESVVIILGYRLLSFWIPSIAGFPIAAYLQNRKG